MKKIFDKIISWANKYKKILLIILVALGLFYWYSLRPSIIKRSCYNTASGEAIEKGKRDGLSNGKFTKDDYDTYYKWCLQKNGL